MPGPALVTVALLVWTLGACVYTAQLWRARGTTDQGAPGLLLLILGSGLMAAALVGASPALAVCALLPAAFAAVILEVKVEHTIRTRWRKPPKPLPAMLSPEPEPDIGEWPEQNPTYAGIGRVGDLNFWTAPPPPVADPEYAALKEIQVEQVPVPDVGARAESEDERARRIARMFG